MGRDRLQWAERTLKTKERIGRWVGRVYRRAVPLFYILQVCLSYTFVLSILCTMDLQINASKVVELDAKIKKLSEQFAALKVELMSQMVADNVSEVVIKRKKVILCHRQNKDFGSEINRQELELKAEKKKLETLGEFTISSVTNFIQVRWHLGEVNRLPFRYTFNPPHYHHD